jgi:hypothetical protein
MEAKNQKPAAPKKPHGFTVDARARATVTGVEKVAYSCPTLLLLETSEGGLSIAGGNLKIDKFDADSGNLAFEGEITSAKYSAAKQPLLKRLFK